jgi:hypothetical protein
MLVQMLPACKSIGGGVVRSSQQEAQTPARNQPMPTLQTHALSQEHRDMAHPRGVGPSLKSRIELVLDMQNRTFGHYLAAKTRILVDHGPSTRCGCTHGAFNFFPANQYQIDRSMAAAGQRLLPLAGLRVHAWLRQGRRPRQASSNP